MRKADARQTHYTAQVPVSGPNILVDETDRFGVPIPLTPSSRIVPVNP